MGLPKILIVQTGSETSMVERYGDHAAWFRRAFDGFADTTSLLRADLGERLDADTLFRSGARGVLVTGSPLSMTEPADWTLRLGEELLRAGSRGVPVLGVCFGHQLLCHAAGVKVVKNPRGLELGTVQVQLTEAGRRDPLFAWAEGSTAEVQATHSDAVYPVPAGATLLASNENTPVQAVRFSETVASVQFHPELDAQMMREMIQLEEKALRAAGLDPAALLSAVRESRGAKLLEAFAAQVARA
jgi:GMP synthase (glutamine-hydrolysing)